MAVSLLARTGRPCKRDSHDYDAPPDPSDSAALRPRMDEARSGMLSPDGGFARPVRTMVIDGRSYVAGPGSVVRIDEITDLPDDLKARLAGGASRLSDSATDETGTNVRSPEPTTKKFDIIDVHAAPEDVPSGRPEPRGRGAEAADEAHGPVFAAAEVAAARCFLKLLASQGFALVMEGGVAVAGARIDPNLCRKLALLGLAAIEDVAGGLIVRRSRSEPCKGTA